jgi:hypothetical protein
MCCNAIHLNHCDLCIEIRALLFQRENGFMELAPAGFYA